MADLTADDFSAFFEAVHNEPETPAGERWRPFAWQKRFARQILDGEGWPDVVRVPTSSGKTTVLDVALFELAMRAGHHPAKQTAARRICFVIDRRLVVDEVTEHARRLHDAVISAAQGRRDEPVLKAVAGRLASLAADGSEPLRVVRLRGGVFRDDGWAADPLTPTILVSTVDQIGSRLLFRGYGVSRRGRPVQAGLLAFDTRIILDEAHLSTAFAETLDHVRQYQRWAEQAPLPESRRVRVVRMSATAGEGTNPPFELTDAERQDGRLKPRLDAGKPAELTEVKVEPVTQKMRQEQPRKARELEHENREKLVRRLVEQAKRLAGLDADAPGDQGDRPRVIGVVVNRVATARRVFEGLGVPGPDEPKREAMLLTGRIRPYDRDRLLRDWLPRIRVGRKSEPECPLFVVATQTVEVGANIDFDGLVTEAAPLDALRQRFGRLDRLGRRHERNAPSRAVILIRSDQKSANDDPVYGSSIALTWKWLNQKGSKKKGQPKQIDFGINHLDPKLPKSADELRPMLASQPEAPLLFPAHLDAWVQTNPVPDPDPDVGPFLHGPAEATADVRVVWRADLEAGGHRAWAETVCLMPPRTREGLPVPLYELRAWLRDQASGQVADVEGAQMGADDQKRRGRRVLRWRGRKDVRVVGPDRIKPGDTVVVPATYGGADRFGWRPQPAGGAPVADVAEACLAQLIASYPPTAYRRPKLRLRLHPLLLDGIDLAPPAKERLKGLLRTAVTAGEAADTDPWPAVKRLLLALKEQVSDPTYRAAIDALLSASQPQIERYSQGKGLVVIAPVSVSLPDEQAAPSEDVEYEEPEGDEASLAPAGREVLLEVHLRAVEKQAGEFARRCGLDDGLKQALALAARWHDEGKRDRRFQAWLHGSELKALAALAAGRPIAKSGRDPDQWGRSDAFGYPRGGRHEFVSVRLFEAATGRDGDSQAHDLVRLLIGTHHGYGRAFVPVMKDHNPVEVASQHDGRTITASSDHRLYRLDSDWVDLFWRTVRRFGWWGLAYLEALLVCADHLVSGSEQRQPATGTEEPAA